MIDLSKKSLKLPERLEAVARMVPAGCSIADIGTDHAYLPVKLVKENYCTRAIASDVQAGPLQAAKKMVRSAGLSAQIELRLGDGLETLQPGEAEVIICAGMGGRLIQKILSGGKPVLERCNLLVLQPNVKVPELRIWLSANNWRLFAEDLVLEKGKFYPVLAAEHGKMELTELEAELGPLLMKEKHPVLLPYLRKKLAGLAAAIEQLQRGAKTHQEKLAGLLKLQQEIQLWLERNLL